MINASNNPFSCEPAVIGLNNQILELGTITRVTNTFTFSLGFKWEINSQIFQNTTTFDYTPATATTGYKRIDIAVLNTNNEIEFLAGTESDTIALRPTIPVNNLLLTQWNIDGATIEDSETPLLGSDYVKKTFAQPFSFTGTGEHATIPLDPLGREEIRLTNASLVSIGGFDLSLITGNPSAEVPYLGKRYRLRNLTGSDVTLLNDYMMPDIIFYSRYGEDIIIPNGHEIEIIYAGGAFAEGIRSWSSGGVNTFVFSQRNVRLSVSLTGGNWNGYIANTNLHLANFPNGFGSDISALTDSQLMSMNGYVIDGVTIKKLNSLSIIQHFVENNTDFDIEVWKYDFLEDTLGTGTILNWRRVIQYNSGTQAQANGSYELALSNDAEDTPSGHFSKYCIFLRTNGGTSFFYPSIDWNFKL